MNVDIAQYPTIKQELDNDPNGVGYSSMTSREKVESLLFRPDVNNPNSPVQVPRPLVKTEVFGMISVASLQNVKDETLYSVGEMIDANDRARLNIWISIVYAKQYITEQEKDSLLAYVNSTVDDPNHPATIKGKTRLETILGIDEPVNFSVDELEAIYG